MHQEDKRRELGVGTNYREISLGATMVVEKNCRSRKRERQVTIEHREFRFLGKVLWISRMHDKDRACVSGPLQRPNILAIETLEMGNRRTFSPLGIGFDPDHRQTAYKRSVCLRWRETRRPTRFFAAPPPQ